MNKVTMSFSLLRYPVSAVSKRAIFQVKAGKSVAQITSQLKTPIQSHVRSFYTLPHQKVAKFDAQWTSKKKNYFTTVAASSLDGATVSPSLSKFRPDVTNNERIRKRVGYWLFGSALMVAGAVTIGGITRLTESGLSMVNWHPVYGIRPPITQEEWEIEFNEYKKYPEYTHVHGDLTVNTFKNIFFWEYLHRMWGRSIGLVFVIPGTYFAARGYMPRRLKVMCFTIASLIGCQGLLGWYMVKSGLEDFSEDPRKKNDMPRVSQYRLAAHLGSAIVIYALMLDTSLRLLLNKGIPTIAGPQTLKVRKAGYHTAALIFITALSGAFVAGLDAGLTYNSFPKMAGRWIPDDLLHFEPKWTNIFENPTTVQFNHRILGMSTFTAILGLWAYTRKAPVSPRAHIAMNSLMAMACVQVGLGISTLLYYVPVSLAAAHQTGSVCLLSLAIWLTKELPIKRLPK